jgi:hypothetical protein
MCGCRARARRGQVRGIENVLVGDWGDARECRG